MPAANLKELVAWLKTNGEKTTMGTSGVGSPSHIAGVLMEQFVGTKWQMISYRSAGLATQDLLAGITDIQLDTPAVSLPHVQSGDLKAYAVTAGERIAVAPDIPTTDEAGLPGFYLSGLLEIVQRLRGLLVARIDDLRRSGASCAYRIGKGGAMAALSLSMIGFGVPLGAHIACQNEK